MDPAPPPWTFKRCLLLVCGWIALGLALVGALLPLVPATPFLLIALACFVRSSPKLYRWLREHKRLGPYVEQWERDKSIPRAAKKKAYLLTCASFAVSFTLAPTTALRVVVAVCSVTVIAILASLRTSDDAEFRARREARPTDPH